MFRSAIIAALVACTVVSAQLDPLPLYRMANTEPEFESRADEAINYRLPNNTIPTHYDISLHTRVDQDIFDFEGYVEITLTALESSYNITLHKRQLLVSDVIVRESGSLVDLDLDWDEDPDTEFFTVQMTNLLVPNRNYVMMINYTGVLRTDQAGFYRSSYTKNGVQTWLATTQFESTDARHGFPCYDEPATKATFTIRITHGSSYFAESNMPVKSVTPSTQDDTVTTEFETTPRMSTYLIAFIVSDFAHIEKKTAGAVPQRLYSEPSKIVDGHYSLDLGVLILEALAKHLDVKFSLPKMDQYAIPDFAAGAMENWGLVTYREEYLLYNELTTAYNYKTSISTVISHEYAHQWFGNLVSPKWWTYLWLNEGFATLFEVYGVHLVHPEWKIMEHFAINTCQNVMSNDVGTLRAMTHYVESPTDVSRLFDSIAYAKSGCVLRMWQGAFTEATFQKGLKYYLDEMEYSSAVEEDLFTGLSKAVKEDKAGALEETLNLNEVFYSWTRQSGYPLVNVTRDYATGAVSLTQKPFRIDGADTTATWWIPFSYSTASDPAFDAQAIDWMPKTATHNLEGTVKAEDWLVLNNQQTGYYRVNYDERNWQMISEALIADPSKINVVNRAQLINDAFTFARYNMLDYTHAMSILQHLKGDAEYVSWQAASNNLAYVNRLMAGSEDYENYKAFISYTVSNLYTKMGVKPVADDLYFNAYARPVGINLACSMGHEQCLTETHERLVDEITNGNKIETNLQNAIFCNGLRTATAEEFKYVFDKLMASTDTFERSRIIPTLSCVQDKEFIYNLMQAIHGSTADYTLTRAERLSMFQSIYTRGNLHVEQVLEFFKNEEYKASFLSRFGETTYNSILSAVASYVVTDDLLKSYTEVLNASTMTQDSQTNSLAVTSANFAWVSAHGPIFNTFLEEHQPDPEPDSATSMSVSLATFVTVAVVFLRNIF